MTSWTLVVRCQHPHCGYDDYGHDTDLIMHEYEKHKQEHTADKGGFFIPERGAHE